MIRTEIVYTAKGDWRVPLTEAGLPPFDRTREDHLSEPVALLRIGIDGAQIAWGVPTGTRGISDELSRAIRATSWGDRDAEQEFRRDFAAGMYRIISEVREIPLPKRTVEECGYRCDAPECDGHIDHTVVTAGHLAALVAGIEAFPAPELSAADRLHARAAHSGAFLYRWEHTGVPANVFGRWSDAGGREELRGRELAKAAHEAGEVPPFPGLGVPGWAVDPAMRVNDHRWAAAVTIPEEVAADPDGRLAQGWMIGIADSHPTGWDALIERLHSATPIAA